MSNIFRAARVILNIKSNDKRDSKSVSWVSYIKF